MTDDPIEALSAERDRAITDACAEASQVMHRMMRDYSMRPEEAAQAVLDFFAAAFAEGECVHGRKINEHGWADCVECEAGDPDGTLPAEPEPEFCNACGQTHVPDNCDLQFEVVDVTVDLTVTIRTTEDPVEYVREVMSFGSKRNQDITVTDVFRNDE